MPFLSCFFALSAAPANAMQIRLSSGSFCVYLAHLLVLRALTRAGLSTGCGGCHDKIMAVLSERLSG